MAQPNARQGLLRLGEIQPERKDIVECRRVLVQCGYANEPLHGVSWIGLAYGLRLRRDHDPPVWTGRRRRNVF
jgi:hypothetical protein